MRPGCFNRDMVTSQPHPSVTRALALRDDPAFQCENRDEAVEMHGGVCPLCGESTMAHDPEPNPAPDWREYERRTRKLVTR